MKYMSDDKVNDVHVWRIDKVNEVHVWWKSKWSTCLMKK